MGLKILIIKLGYSETLDNEIGRTPSLGDVLRTTPILWAIKEKYPNSHVTWLVSEHAEQLLHGNKFINRILVWDTFVAFQLMREKFDILINLEKISGIAALSDMIDGWTRYGFRFDSITGSYHAYESGLSFIDYIERKKKTNNTKDFWQKVLIEMIGVEWKGQEYIIGYKPKTEEKYDVGLNCEVGSKWPTKAMPMERWKELEKRLLDSGYSVSWQRGLKDLYEYMDWINSCKLIISTDSLGIHLAFTFKKNVIGIFGSTDSQEIYFYDKGKVIHSEQECTYMPCYYSKCITGLNCMNNIDIDKVVETSREMLNK